MQRGSGEMARVSGEKEVEGVAERRDVTGNFDKGSAVNDELEFSISQYLDGTLSAPEAAALEQVLASDAAARALLDEYRQLDALIKSAPLPAVRWDALASSISSAIDAQQDQQAA